MNYGQIDTPRKGMFEWRCDDYVHGYEETKQAAIDKVIAYCADKSLDGSGRSLNWFVGVVVDIQKRTTLKTLQRGDGTGIFDREEYAHRICVITSTVAFGYCAMSATYEEKAHGVAQGRAR